VRPSPIYIEIAQKVAVWNGTWSGNATPNWTSGTLGYWYQIRGRAWGMRSLAHAAFLTPDAAEVWRTSCLGAINNSAAYLDAWRTDSKAALGAVWDASPSSLSDHASNSPHFQVAVWQHHYLVTEYHKLASAKLLPADQQAVVERLANWLAAQPVRWVNERPDGGWRYVPYSTAIGPSKTAISSPSTWGAEMASFMTDAPSGQSGPWRTFYNNVASSYAGMSDENAAGATYVSYFWSALVAAVERGVPGATTAWQTVQAGVTNLNAWRSGFSADPRWGAAPRVAQAASVPVATTLGNDSAAGSVVGNLWTPARNAQGVVNRASWDIVPAGRWIDVAGTRLDALDAVVKAAIPGWQDRGTGKWLAVTHAWNGVAIDEAGGRAWWICCGGHDDGSNNGIYRFDGFKMSYAVEKMPSDSTQWSSSYRAGFTFCPESAEAGNAARAAGTWTPINDWHYDELFWDRQPTARHVYSGVTYLPDSNELVMCVRRLWRFSLTTNKWTYKRLVDNGTPGQYADVGEENILHYDQVNKQLQIFSCGSGMPFGNIYDLSQDKWLGVRPPAVSWTYDGAADYRYGDLVTIFKQPEDPTGANYPSPGSYIQYNVTTRAVVASGQVQFAGGLAQTQFAVGYDGAGMVYVPPLNKFWTVLKLKTGALQWAELDPTTTPWTLRPLNHTGAVPSLTYASVNVRRRMMWVPSLNAVVFLGSADRNVTVFKV
jgi:hypothetical protein